MSQSRRVQFEPLFTSANLQNAEAISVLTKSSFISANPHLLGPILGMLATGKVNTLEEAQKKVQLSEAVRMENLKLLEDLLKSCASPNDPVFDESLLTQAFWHGKTESVRLLLKFGADPNPATGCPPLLQAINRQNIEGAKLLIAAGANVNSLNAGEQPELFTACLSCNQQMVELLLSNSVEVDRRGTAYVTKKHIVQRVTPLMITAWLGKPKILQQLLNSGANPQLKDDEGWNASNWATRCRSKKAREEVVAILSIN